MKIRNSSSAATIYEMNWLIEWNNTTELERLLLGSTTFDPETAHRAFGKEVRMFYLLLAEKKIDSLSTEMINFALSDKLTALASLLPFEAAAVGRTMIAAGTEYIPSFPEEVKRYLSGREENPEKAANELIELEDDEIISALLFLEKKNVSNLGPMNQLFLTAVFTSEIFEFSDFFRLLAAGVPIGFYDYTTRKRIENSVFR